MTFTHDSATNKLNIASVDVSLSASARQRVYCQCRNPWRGRPCCAPGVTRAQVLDGSMKLSYELVTAPRGWCALSDDGAITGVTLTPLTVAGDLPRTLTMASPEPQRLRRLRRPPLPRPGGEALLDRWMPAQKSVDCECLRACDSPPRSTHLCAQGRPGLRNGGWNDAGKRLRLSPAAAT